MNEKQFDKLKVGSKVKETTTDEEYAIIEKDELGVVLNDGYYYKAEDFEDFILIKK